MKIDLFPSIKKTCCPNSKKGDNSTYSSFLKVERSPIFARRLKLPELGNMLGVPSISIEKFR